MRDGFIKVAAVTPDILWQTVNTMQNRSAKK